MERAELLRARIAWIDSYLRDVWEPTPQRYFLIQERGDHVRELEALNRR